MKNVSLMVCLVFGVACVAVGDSPRDKVCMYYDLGPTSGPAGEHAYLANYFYGDTCDDYVPIEWLSTNPPFPGSCTPPADCQNCESLGRGILTASTKATATPIILTPPASIVLNDAVDASYITTRLPNETGGGSLPYIQTIGTPRYYKIPNTGPTGGFHYIVIVRREVGRTLMDGRIEYFDATIGFELSPTDMSVVKDQALPFNGKVRKVNLFTRTGSIPLVNCLEFQSGSTKSYVCVKDSESGWKIFP